MKKSEALEAVRHVCRLRHYSIETERAYCGWVARYADWLKDNRTQATPERRMEMFLTSLAEADVAASTQNQAFNAVRFLYVECLKIKLEGVDALRARKPQRARVCPSRQDTDAILRDVRDHADYPTRLIVHMLYGAGLRVSEPLNLRTKDLDLDKAQMTIRAAKGDKDRVVAIPPTLLEPLRDQLRVAYRVWEGDVERGLPVPLPGLLARKYPSAPFSWSWAWVFPAHGTCAHPRTGEIVRYRCHEANVQRALKASVKRLGITDIITPHHLRHAYATHALEQGNNIRALQSAMGHASLETTMIYTHADGLDVRTPLSVPLNAPAKAQFRSHVARNGLRAILAHGETRREPILRLA